MIISFPKVMSLGLIRGENVGIYKDNGHDWDFRLTIVDLVAQASVGTLNAFYAKPACR